MSKTNRTVAYPVEDFVVSKTFLGKSEEAQNSFQEPQLPNHLQVSQKSIESAETTQERRTYECAPKYTRGIQYRQKITSHHGTHAVISCGEDDKGER